MKKTTFENVKSVLYDYCRQDIEIELHHRLVEDLDIDSLELVEFIMAVEEEFDIDVIDEDVEHIKYVSEVVDAIEKIRNGEKPDKPWDKDPRVAKLLEQLAEAQRSNMALPIGKTRNNVATLLAIAAIIGSAEEQSNTPAVDENETFHEHLSKCKQCADHPFSLCKTGVRLIKVEAEGLHS